MHVATRLSKRFCFPLLTSYPRHIRHTSSSLSLLLQSTNSSWSSSSVLLQRTGLPSVLLPPSSFFHTSSLCGLRRRFDDFDDDCGDDDAYARRFDGRHSLGRRSRHDDDFGQRLERRHWDQVHLSEPNRLDYKPPAELTEAQRQVFFSENNIEVRCSNGSVEVPSPILDFDQAGIFGDALIKKLRSSGFETPMPIQAQGWPIVLSGLDTVAIGETGSGKTLAFMLPALAHIQAQSQTFRREAGPTVAIVAPTRELAQQIYNVASEFGRVVNVRATCVFGGSGKGAQIRDLQRGVDIVVGTPGRMIDLLRDQYLILDNCIYLVLDEADRMLDMGFEPQIRRIVSRVRPERQMLMFSATWPSEVRQLAKDFLSKSKPYVHLNIGSEELKANDSIEQRVKVVPDGQKVRALLSFLNEHELKEGDRVLIFAQTKRTVDFIERLLRSQNDMRVNGIHGDKTQSARDKILSDFRSGRIPVLVATDVASRGLDVDDIKVVINYDHPPTTEDYIHRIGRTGRRGRKGISFTLVTGKDGGSAIRNLIDVLHQSKQEVPEELHVLSRNEDFRGHTRSRSKPYAPKGLRYKRHY